jgi:hypothetical protein
MFPLPLICLPSRIRLIIPAGTEPAQAQRQAHADQADGGNPAGCSLLPARKLARTPTNDAVEDLGSIAERSGENERQRHSRIDAVIDSTELLAFYVLRDEDDLS